MGPSLRREEFFVIFNLADSSQRIISFPLNTMSRWSNSDLLQSVVDAAGN